MESNNYRDNAVWKAAVMLIIMNMKMAHKIYGGGGTPGCFTVIISVLVDVVYTNG